MPENTSETRHQWLRYSSQHASLKQARQIVTAWLSYGSGAPASSSKLRKAEAFDVAWTDKQGVHHRTKCRFDDLVEHVAKSCDFDTEAFGLPPIGSLTIRQDFHYSQNIPPKTDHTGTFQVRCVGSLGEAFPLVPTLDREGMIFTSVESVLYGSVVDLRARLVERSAGMVVEGPAWFNDLRMLVNDVVSAVDIALNHLYLLAKHSPKSGWRFVPAKLGERYGRRMEDKLRWVEAITARPLNAAEPRAAFTELRELRNHLNHFDPPCLAYSVEDAAGWLNLVPRVGELLWEIRKCMGEPLARDLVRWILQRPVGVEPRDRSLPRPAQLATAGYASTRWSRSDGE